MMIQKLIQMQEKLMAGIEPAKVNIHVQLGETEITLDDF